MKTIGTNRFILWALIFLAIINITALLSFFLFARNTTNTPVKVTDNKPGVTLTKELSLSADQDKKVKDINSEYKVQSGPIVDSIKSAKSKLLEELSKEKTDAQLVDNILKELGVQQGNLQRANVKQFLELKQVCTPEQTLRLSEIYAELYGCNFMGNGEGKGMKHRHRYGKQRGANN